MKDKFVKLYDDKNISFLLFISNMIFDVPTAFFQVVTILCLVYFEINVMVLLF